MSKRCLLYWLYQFLSSLFSGKGDVPGGVIVEYFFELFPILETYDMASASCKKKGGFLASIRDQADLDKILMLMAK